jgi:hypothetical protein
VRVEVDDVDEPAWAEYSMNLAEKCWIVFYLEVALHQLSRIVSLQQEIELNSPSPLKRSETRRLATRPPVVDPL